jgi:hypothetical protein
MTLHKLVFRSFLIGLLFLVSLLSVLAAPTHKDYFPSNILDRPLGIESLPDGRVLITDAGGAFYTLTDAALLEVDREGQVVWSYVGDMSFPHSAGRLPDGTTLVSDTANDRVFRVDAQGQVVWTSDSWGNGAGTLGDGSHLLYPNNAELLANGNLLITDRNNDRVVEATRDGAVAWQYAGLNRPHNAHRLPDGNTIICNSEDNLVVEVNPQGEVVWKFGDAFPLRWPRDADRLPNGNTLVTDTRNGRVLEVTPEGQVVWSYGGLALPYEADRLENGNTLIADNDHRRVIEVNPAGEIVWLFRNFPETYPEALQNGDFEADADGDGLPDGWYPADMNAEGPVTFTWEPGQAHQGEHSAGIVYQGTGRATWLQVVAVTPGQTYEFSGFLRTDLREGLAAYQLWFVDALGGPIGDPTTAEPTLQGTSDWQEARSVVTAPAGAAAVQIWCQRIAGDGTAWFDQVRFGKQGTSSSLLPWLGLAGGILLVGAGVVFVWRRRARAK